MLQLSLGRLLGPLVAASPQQLGMMIFAHGERLDREKSKFLGDCSNRAGRARQGREGLRGCRRDGIDPPSCALTLSVVDTATLSPVLATPHVAPPVTPALPSELFSSPDFVV